MDKKEHIYYFDYLRVISAFFVIYMHVAAGPLRHDINISWHPTNLFTSFGFTAVPIFFMMSGYLILSSSKTSDITTLFKKRLPHLVVPLIGWTVVAILWNMVNTKSFSFSFLYEKLVSSLSTPAAIHFWYMYTLIALYVISPLLYGGLHSLDKKGHILVISLCLLVSIKLIIKVLAPPPPAVDAYLNIDIITKMTFFSGHASSFVLGWYLGNIKKKIPNIILFIGAALLLAVITIGTYIKSVASGEYNQSFQTQSAGFEVILAAFVFLIFKQNFNKKSKILSLIPIVPLTLAIYMMHNILLSMLYSIGLSVKSFFDTLWVSILIFVVCYLVMKTVATIKPICYLATGMTYKSACNCCNWIYTYKKIFKK